MKIFFAGADSYITKYELLKNCRILISYADFKNYGVFKRWCKQYKIPINGYKEGEREVFLDSGAFGAFNSGKKIDLYEYIGFVDHFKKTFSHIAALDVIGNAEKSMSNYKAMLHEDLPVIPAWHHGEDWSYFDEYCRLTDYVALGGIAKLSFSRSDYVEKLIKKAALRKPKHVKLHVYGIMSVPILKRVGQYVESVDSTTWLNSARFGLMLQRAGNKLMFKNVNDALRQKLMRYNIRMFMQIEEDINNANKVSPNGYSDLLRNTQATD